MPPPQDAGRVRRGGAGGSARQPLEHAHRRARAVPEQREGEPEAAQASRLGVDVATLRRWRAPGGWLHVSQGGDAS